MKLPQHELTKMDNNLTLLPRSNDTETGVRSIYQTAIASFFLILTMIIAIVGNTAVIVVVRINRSMRREISNLLIINLSITDLANTCFVMLSAITSLLMDNWPFGKIWCDCVCAINYCLIIVSMLTLCCISLDRYQAVIHPLTYRSRVTRQRLIMVIIYMWFQGIIFGVSPSLAHWVNFDYWEAICAIQWHLYRPSTIVYVVIAFVLCFLGPGIILVYCYAKILKEAKKPQNRVTIQVQDSKKKAKRVMSDGKRIMWSLLVVVFAYFICTTPFSLTKLVKVSVAENYTIPGSINLTASLLGYFASAINPLIYGIFRRDFRRAYKHLLMIVFLKGRRQSSLESINHSNSKVLAITSELNDVSFNKSTDSDRSNQISFVTNGTKIQNRQTNDLVIENEKSNEKTCQNIYHETNKKTLQKYDMPIIKENKDSHITTSHCAKNNLKNKNGSNNGDLNITQDNNLYFCTKKNQTNSQNGDHFISQDGDRNNLTPINITENITKKTRRESEEKCFQPFDQEEQLSLNSHVSCTQITVNSIQTMKTIPYKNV